MSKIVQEWLASRPFQLLQRHAQPPDLNLIEHFWAFLKQCLNESTTFQRGIQELWESMYPVYPDFSVNDCMVFSENMP